MKYSPEMGHTDGRGFSHFRVLEGVEVVLDVYNGRLLDRDSKEWIWLRGLCGFWFWRLVSSRWAARGSWGNALRRDQRKYKGCMRREHTGVKAIA